MGVTAAVGLTLYTVNEQSKREDRVNAEQKKQRNVEVATRSEEARKARRAQIRETRLRQAEAANMAATSGQTGSSAAVAAGDVLQGKLGSNVGDINTALLTSNLMSNAQQNVSDAGRKSTGELLGTTAINLFGAV